MAAAGAAVLLAAATGVALAAALFPAGWDWGGPAFEIWEPGRGGTGGALGTTAAETWLAAMRATTIRRSKAKRIFFFFFGSEV